MQSFERSHFGLSSHHWAMGCYLFQRIGQWVIDVLEVYLIHWIQMASLFQVWDEFEDYSERFRKTLYYGRIPSSDRLSLPVTELCVKQFNDLGIGDLEEKLNSLNVSRAADITRETCASPTSLVLALLYLDRLRSTNPKYLASISSTDLFLISLVSEKTCRAVKKQIYMCFQWMLQMVTSKFLYDDGEEDEVFNDEWATSGQMEKKELNKLELDFLMAIDWNIFVSPDEFEVYRSNEIL